MILRLGGPRLIDKLNSTKDEAVVILQEMGIVKDTPDPRRMLEKLVIAGALVDLGDGLYHFSDEASK